MNKKNNNNQRGSALLLTLGILSLALILAMSFAFSARTNRQVAMVNADQIKARLLAESGWQRLRASMEWNFGAISYDSLAKTFTKIGTYYYPPVDGRLGFSDSNKLTSNHYEQRYTTISASATDDSEESFNKLDKIFSNHSALFKDLEGMGLSITGTKFQTILDAGKVGSPVTGRLGFLILEEGGKFDINQLVSPIVSSPPPPDNIPFVKLDTRIPPNYQGEQLAKFGLTFDYENDFYYNILGNYSVGSYIEPNTKRLGLCMQELIVDALFDTSRPQGYSTTKAPWFSYEHLKNELGTTFTDKYLAYHFFSGQDIEAYWDVDSTTYNNSKERQRFDITGFEWRDKSVLTAYYDSGNKPIPAKSGWEYGDGGGTNDSATYARALVAALVNTDNRPEFWNTATPPRPEVVERVDCSTTTFPADFGIPAIRHMTGSYVTLNQQVAANLVDYCDSDGWATVPDDVTWGTVPSIITYCGNEKVPYFNEVACRFIVSKATTPDGSGGFTYTYRLRLVPSIEMVNIFETNITIPDCRVRITGTWAFDGNGAEVASGNFNIPFDFSSFLVPSLSYNVHYFTEADSAPLHEAVDLTTDYSDPQYSFSISAIYMLSGDNSSSNTISDAALWNTGTVQCEAPIFSTGTQSFYLNIEANDPRCNHQSQHWTLNNTCSDSACIMTFAGFHTTDHLFTLSEDNENFESSNDGTTKDKETDVTFETSPKKSFSTAFIRNGPMETLWELGAIHRGEPYRTINLNKFSPSVGGYAAGDSLILDQVKIGPAKLCRGKFNPNARSPQAIADLLSGIYTGNNPIAYKDMITSGTNVNATSVSFSGTPSQYRGQFVDNTLSALVNAAPDDRSAEAYIGKTAHLLSTRLDAYTVIVVAQALQDLTAGGISWTNGPENPSPDPVIATLINPTKYTLASPPSSTPGTRYCNILATQLMMVHIVRDTWKNEYEIIQIKYLED